MSGKQGKIIELSFPFFFTLQGSEIINGKKKRRSLKNVCSSQPLYTATEVTAAHCDKP